jgi:hypothetical protein
MKEKTQLPVADNEENMKKCICPKCPSYPGESCLFCARGKSNKPIRKTECICIHCPLWLEKIRLACFFCFYGAAVSNTTEKGK